MVFSEEAGGLFSVLGRGCCHPDMVFSEEAGGLFSVLVRGCCHPDGRDSVAFSPRLDSVRQKSNTGIDIRPLRVDVPRTDGGSISGSFVHGVDPCVSAHAFLCSVAPIISNGYYSSTAQWWTELGNRGKIETGSFTRDSPVVGPELCQRHRNANTPRPVFGRTAGGKDRQFGGAAGAQTKRVWAVRQVAVRCNTPVPPPVYS